ncbi:VanW family protein [Bacillus marinisedimentorum]|uniref:VanW family protein n=1 Tax=Bacillus marinisedimentorum TaxID=1821260 RepID=UPI000872D169|nr:VanW family protein [Bacillus marinisedimentorum]
MRLALFAIILLIIQPAGAGDHLSIRHDGEEILNIRRGDFFDELAGKPLIDQDKTLQLTEHLKQEVKKDPIDAKLNDTGEIVPEEAGYQLNGQKFLELFYTYLLDSKPAVIEAPRLTLHPRVDSELLANIRTKQIGQYVTYFNTRNEERSHNIQLAAEALDNHVVFPGETFSFNRVVGKRTTEKGYLPAPVIVKGEVTEGIGGGICQLSSTIYNAADIAGVKIVERYSHSKQVPYVPPGRDAAVSWYGPDFTFKNTYSQPLLIRTNVRHGMVSVTIYSSDHVDVKKRGTPGLSEKNK